MARDIELFIMVGDEDIGGARLSLETACSLLADNAYPHEILDQLKTAFFNRLSVLKQKAEQLHNPVDHAKALQAEKEYRDLLTLIRYSTHSTDNPELPPASVMCPTCKKTYSVLSVGQITIERTGKCHMCAR